MVLTLSDISNDILSDIKASLFCVEFGLGRALYMPDKLNQY